MFGINKTLKPKNSTKKLDGIKANKIEKDNESKKKSIVPDLICKSYVEGCLVLGCIHDVSNTELIVSLPGIGNFGYIKFNNISSVYTDLLRNETKDALNTLSNMYSKGNLLRCKIINYANKKLNLTIEPNEVNSSLSSLNLEENMIISGAVKTKEDHGYTIDLGINDLTGFYRTNDSELSIGQTCLFKITSKKSERAITLKLCDSDSESSFYEVKTRTKFDTYLPGSQITCTVEKSGKNGLQANVGNQIYAYVHTNHLPISKRNNNSTKKEDTTSSKKQSSTYSNGDKITGTIIFLNPYSKVVYLSLLPHLINSTKIAKVASLFLNEEEENLKLGQIVNDAQVSAHTYKGIYVKFKGQNSKLISGFIPKRHLFDKTYQNDDDNDESDQENEQDEAKKSEKENLKKAKKDPKNLNKEELERLFPMNSNLKARIYDYSLIEDIILLSIRPSVLQATYMTYDELKLGQIVKCTIKSINTNNGGINVRLSEFITGFIPKIHTSDVPLSENLLTKKMKPGSEIKCRIIQLDADTKRCVLTAKKSLIKTKLILIDSFDNVSIGMETYGVVVSIQKYGLLLGFSNDLKGLLPRNQISTSQEVLSEQKDLKDLYYVGQLIKCRVYELNKEKQQIKLSLLMEEDDNTQDEKKTQKKEKITKMEETIDYEIGDLIETAEIVQINEESFFFKVKLPKSKVNGIIYKNHLSDFDCLNDILFECFKRTKKLNNLMITRYASDITKTKLENINNQKISHYLTAKTTLIDEYTNKPKTEIAKHLSELKVNDYHSGWVKKLLPNGLLVELPFNLTGFVPNQDIQYVNELRSTPNGLTIGQSVLVKVVKVQQDKNQFLASIRNRFNLSQKNPNEIDFMSELFKSYLTNTKLVFNLLENTQETTSSAQVHPNIVANREIWEKSAKKIQIGNIVKIAVKNYNKTTQQIECVFIDDLDKNLTSNLTGIAYATEDKPSLYNQGTKYDALVLGFDPISKVFCLTIDSKQVKTYKKNFDQKFRSQIVCKSDQLIKAEVIYCSDWFCIVGLKAHALGRLAFMPLFKNHFTQLNTINAESTLKTNVLSSLDHKIKKQQLVTVSSASISSIMSKSDDVSTSDKAKIKKEDKEFLYYAVNQIGKVCVRLNGSNQVDNLDYLIVTHDLSDVKKSKKTLLRQLAVLNEIHQETNSTDLKRKLDDNNDPVLVRKKLVLDAGLHKRKLSNISNDEDDENNKEETKDFIEIVADVKTKKPKMDQTKTNDHEIKNIEFPWEVTDFDMFNKVINNLNGDDNDTEEAETNDSGKKTDKKKKKSNFIDDRKLHQIEERAFDPNRPPESVDDYERLVVSSPNNSYLWIKYMAYHLQIGESDKARNLAKRALSQINYREDAERLNVWVALLNLENLYGSQASVDDTFNQATQNCDSFKVHSHMAEIYSSTSKLQEAEDVYLKMTRKFNNLPETWIKYAIFHYKHSNCESARKILLRSLNSLDKRDHVDIVNKFAQLEFKYGDLERAKTMYDSLLFTFPNRTDIWSVYIDLLVKHQKHDDARQVFNRIVQLGLSAKRMKFIFKKYMDFEKAHGSEELCDKVKEMAVKYVESNNSKKETNEDKQNGSVEANLKKNLFN